MGPGTIPQPPAWDQTQSTSPGPARGCRLGRVDTKGRGRKKAPWVAAPTDRKPTGSPAAGQTSKQDGAGAGGREKGEVAGRAEGGGEEQREDSCTSAWWSLRKSPSPSCPPSASVRHPLHLPASARQPTPLPAGGQRQGGGWVGTAALSPLVPTRARFPHFPGGLWRHRCSHSAVCQQLPPV